MDAWTVEVAQCPPPGLDFETFSGACFEEADDEAATAIAAASAWQWGIEADSDDWGIEADSDDWECGLQILRTPAAGGEQGRLVTASSLGGLSPPWTLGSCPLASSIAVTRGGGLWLRPRHLEVDVAGPRVFSVRAKDKARTFVLLRSLPNATAFFNAPGAARLLLRADGAAPCSEDFAASKAPRATSAAYYSLEGGEDQRPLSVARMGDELSDTETTPVASAWRGWKAGQRKHSVADRARSPLFELERCCGTQACWRAVQHQRRRDVWLQLPENEHFFAPPGAVFDAEGVVFRLCALPPAWRPPSAVEADELWTAWLAGKGRAREPCKLLRWPGCRGLFFEGATARAEG